ncbi:OmpA/MotB family protein [Paenibacillus apiarius]|uniref:Flagellar motor protein MotB n=1 Tax=Paenibacillus apiarius TaxID=46240 RepID=A0ABT4DSC9_9BACL|nr:flagellar motor protein MotB [Paenibacillus apiarius]MBN3523833.1 flagellar motor protein MotB [Paenibacillus apiarius]MCY9514146.1 flagellar motor protein MotB [Paenibacillus apiarius]MCY9520269.1 flagellar motor protein MotB [Paenibacillus apiarius]MCY9550389.1 flagellar motor protein MotB [Paenibacillus apiarius]MCY9557451.1 flagellar motor protein MotB [Paenibacillus apiarius]
MRRRNRRGAAKTESHERWLITYADLITLLMIFFVIMYAMSQVDADKYESLSETLQLSFRNADSALPKGAGILDGGFLKTGETGALDTAQDGGSGDMKEEHAVAIGTITNKDLAFRKQEEELKSFMNVIQQYVDDNKLGDQIEVSDIPKGIAIRMSDKLLFDLSRADLKQKAMPTMDKLASLFPQLNTTISIEGHTDNLAFAPGGRYKDNWELSAARALSVLRFLVDEKKLDPEQFQIAGYGETRPVVDNKTEEHRQQNRRVEIIVLRKMVQ